MTLRRKTLFIVGLTLVGLLVVLYFTSTTILLGGFARVEEQDTRQNAQRVLAAYADEIAKLNLTAGDWASWDDTYAFVEDSNESYIKTNLTESSISRIGLTLITYIQPSGRIVFSMA